MLLLPWGHVPVNFSIQQWPAPAPAPAVRFYSPSCGACKKFAPSFESAASKGSSNFTFARMAPGETVGHKGGFVGPVGWNWGPVFYWGCFGGEEWKGMMKLLGNIRLQLLNELRVFCL